MSLSKELRKRKLEETTIVDLDNKSKKKTTKKRKTKKLLDLENIPPRPKLDYYKMNKKDLQESIIKILKEKLDKIPIDWLRGEYINYKMISR